MKKSQCLGEKRKVLAMIPPSQVGQLVMQKYSHKSTKLIAPLHKRNRKKRSQNLRVGTALGTKRWVGASPLDAVY